MFSGCFPLPDFKKAVPDTYVEHDLSTLSTAALDFAAI